MVIKSKIAKGIGKKFLGEGTEKLTKEGIQTLTRLGFTSIDVPTAKVWKVFDDPISNSQMNRLIDFSEEGAYTVQQQILKAVNNNDPNALFELGMSARQLPEGSDPGDILKGVQTEPQKRNIISGLLDDDKTVKDIDQVANELEQAWNKLRKKYPDLPDWNPNKIKAGNSRLMSDQKVYNLAQNFAYGLREAGVPQKEMPYIRTIHKKTNNATNFFADYKEVTKKYPEGRLAFRDILQKLDESATHNTQRLFAVELQTLDKADLKKWYQSLEVPQNWEGHHLNQIKLLSVLTEYLSPSQAVEIFKYIQETHGLFTGASVGNKMAIPKPLHRAVHGEMKTLGLDWMKLNFKDMTIDEIKVFIDTTYAPKMLEIQEYVFDHMMKSKHGTEWEKLQALNK